MEEAGETFQQKEKEIAKIQSELDSVTTQRSQISAKYELMVIEKDSLHAKIQSIEGDLSESKSEIEKLKSQLAGRKDSPFLFKGKENVTSALSKARALGLGPKSVSTISLSSQSSGHNNPTPVHSTQGTPYLAMHTKSSLLRLHATQNSPAKVDKCLDQSCFANDDNRPRTRRMTRNGKRKSAAMGLEAETRATKKRKAATNSKKRVSSNVFKRVYATRSRTKKSE